MVVHVFNLIIWEAEAGASLSLMPAQVPEQVPRQPELHGETLSRKNQKQLAV